MQAARQTLENTARVTPFVELGEATDEDRLRHAVTFAAGDRGHGMGCTNFWARSGLLGSTPAYRQAISAGGSFVSAADVADNQVSCSACTSVAHGSASSAQNRSMLEHCHSSAEPSRGKRINAALGLLPAATGARLRGANTAALLFPLLRHDLLQAAFMGWTLAPSAGGICRAWKAG